MVESIEEGRTRHNDGIEGVALSLAMAVDRDEMVTAIQELLEKLTAQPDLMSAAWQELANDLAAIATGFSLIDPTQDARFSDEAFVSHPYFRQVAQSYIAWSRALDTWLDTLALEGMEARRAQFLMGMFKDVCAPVNSFQFNPAALREMFDTRGESVRRGMRNFLDDLRHNHGYPAVADRDGFRIGIDVAASAGTVVHREALFELIAYQPTTDTVHEIPFLYVFSQVNRFYLGDLTPDRSLFQELLAAGIQVYAISWRNPGIAERDWNLATYAQGVVDALNKIKSRSGQDKVNLMGLCAGGITTASAAAMLAAQGDTSINSHSLFVNILDNHPEDSDFGLFVNEQSIAAQKERVQAKGIFDEKDVFEMFAMLTPEESVMAFYRDNWLQGKAPPVHPLLFWSMDYTRVPAGLQCDYLDLAWRNDLVEGHQVLGDQPLDLTQLIMDTYIMAGSTDHITPWRGCYRSTQCFGGHVEFVLTNQNHTQTISNKPNRHMKYWRAETLPEDPDDWIEAASEFPGSWREHWIAWLQARSGDEVPANEGALPVSGFGSAPGQYVFER